MLVVPAGVAGMGVAVHERGRHAARVDRGEGVVEPVEPRLLLDGADPAVQAGTDPRSQLGTAAVGHAPGHELIGRLDAGALDAVGGREDPRPGRQVGAVEVGAGRLGHEQASVVAGGDHDRREVGRDLTQPRQRADLAAQEHRELLQPPRLRPVVHPPQGREVPRALRGDRERRATAERVTAPRHARRRTADHGVRGAVGVIGRRPRRQPGVDRTEPRRDRCIDLGEVGDRAAGWAGPLGSQQAQHGDVRAEKGTCGRHEVAHLLPVGQRRRERGRRAQHRAVVVDEHEGDVAGHPPTVRPGPPADGP